VPTDAPERAPLDRPAVARPDLGGFALAIAASAAFSTSGTFAKALLDAGWSPGAAVITRITLAGILLLVPAVLALRGRWSTLRRNAGVVVLYGALAVAGCQFFYFNAVQTLSVGVALLLEYLGLVLVVGWNWFRDRQAPDQGTLIGVGLAIAGLVLVLDVTGDSKVDLVGVLWGLGAAVGLATFFVASAHDTSGLPPIAMSGAGMFVGAAILGVAAALGAMPFEWSTDDVELAGSVLPFWVPIVGVAVIAGAFSYSAGVAAARRLGSKLSAFVGLTEILFAVLIAWWLLDETLAPVQFVGGALILGGVAAVRAGTGEGEEPAIGAEPLPDPGPE
jgi:drug/metabolite transporter (DMT)-like permease